MTESLLVQSQRLDRRLVDCSRNRQTVVALEIGEGRSGINAQRTRYFSIIIARILQGGLDVCDHFVGEQITISVDWPIVIVVALQWIISIRWIPVAPVQEIISSADENDGITMIVPPVSVMPLVPVTAERIVIADVIMFVAPFFGVRVFY